VGLSLVEGIILRLSGILSPAEAWNIDDVTLPYGPEGIKMAGGINKEVMPQTGIEPINLVDGLAGSTLTLTGTLCDDEKSDVELWNEIITPLQEKRGLEVTLVCPIVGLCGPYLLETFDVNRPKKLEIYEYTMRLSKGSLNITYSAAEE
jgi:hypothetical protein